jgi:hypothetical protein
MAGRPSCRQTIAGRLNLEKKRLQLLERCILPESGVSQMNRDYGEIQVSGQPYVVSEV